MWLLNTLVILSVFGVIYGDAKNQEEDQVVNLNDFISIGNTEVKTEDDGILVLTTDNFELVTK